MKTKMILASKTFWLNVLALLLLLWPAARAWVSANPVEPLAVLGALNVVVRFLTSGGVSLFGSDGADETSGDGDSGSRVLGVSAAMLLACGLAGILGLSLPACSPQAAENFQRVSQAVPVKACYVDENGNQVCYSTKDGVTVVVDRRSSK